MRYIQQIAQETIPAEKELLNEKKRYNDYILTTLRTIWGINLNFVKSQFSNDFEGFLLNSIQKWINSGHILKNDDVFTLNQKGKLMADHIAADLFWVD